MERLRDVATDSQIFEDVMRAALTRSCVTAWSVEVGEFWCSVTPPEYRLPAQGWKLHVSATLLAAPVVLARVTEVLVRAGCAFKFAKGFRQLEELLSGRCERGSGGKFITAYPVDDDQFRRLAEELDQVTDGLPGPVILSDRRMRPDSLVHYRYGVFGAARVYTDDGRYVSMLTGPGNQSTEDERLAWFNPPSWVEPVFPAPAETPREPAAVLIGDRFEVSAAIRHSYRGGLFLAVDRESGDEVVIKQARAHVMGSLGGTDGRDLLRHEARMLDRLTQDRLAPRKLAIVEQQGDLFLVEELIPGKTLREWVADRVAPGAGGIPLRDAIALATQLVDVVSRVHERGLVLADLNPNNVMVTPDHRLRLVDLEHTLEAGSRAVGAYTPGYAGPDRSTRRWPDPGEDPSGDMFALGATLLYLVSGVSPVLPDEPVGRRVQDRLARLISSAGNRTPVLNLVAPLLMGLTRDDPTHRWGLERARDFLSRVPLTTSAQVGADRTPDVPLDRLLSDGLHNLLDVATREDMSQWARVSSTEAADPVNVYHGAAGVLAVLTRAARTRAGDELSAGVSRLAEWIDERRFDIERLLPGLYVGRSGTAWALHNAATLVDDDRLAAHAVELLTRIPLVGANPDVMYGTAGAGLAHLHVWRATGDPLLERRISLCADGVLAASYEQDGHQLWRLPDGGPPHFGFAHGVAGIGAFLLGCGLALGRHDYLEAAVAAGETLHAAADVQDGSAWWPAGPPAEVEPERLTHWCSGSSGVGTFLVRLWAATGDQRYRDLAEAAATAVRLNTWHATNASCHGLAGNGEFLLDLADYTGQDRYRRWATELAEAMYARSIVRGGLTLLPDASGTTEVVGYGTGLAGPVSFLLRLHHGGPRIWMPAGQPAPTRPAAVNGLLTPA